MVWWTFLITAKVSSVPCSLLAESGKSSSSPPKNCLEISRTASWKATTSPHSICSSPGQASIASSRSRSSSSGVFSRTGMRRMRLRSFSLRRVTLRRRALFLQSPQVHLVMQVVEEEHVLLHPVELVALVGFPHPIDDGFFRGEVVFHVFYALVKTHEVSPFLSSGSSSISRSKSNSGAEETSRMRTVASSRASRSSSSPASRHLRAVWAK